MQHIVGTGANGGAGATAGGGVGSDPVAESRREPRLGFVTCTSPVGMHRMAYHEWGDPTNPRVLVCVHGLSRSGRDFDRLARCLTDQYRIICPDLVGRGQSDWLVNPAFYTVPQYVCDMVTLLARIDAQTLHWVGTSLGGLVGMALGGNAALSMKHRNVPVGERQLAATDGLRIERIVLNDVGPHINPASLMRIGQHVSEPGGFDSFAHARDYVRHTAATFGPHTDEQWDELTHNVYVKQDGRWVKHYDLGISASLASANPMTALAGEQLLWQAYDALDGPVLIVRGEQSDLLTTQTTREMLARNAHARLIEFAGVGHAPTLMHDAQIEPVVRFLLD